VIRRIHASKTPFEPPVDPGEKDHGPVESYFEVTETKQPCTPCGVQAFTIKASLKAKSKLQTTHSELASNVAPLLGSDDSDTKELVAAATDALANYPDFLATAAAVEKAGRRLMAATVEKCLTDGIDRVQLSKAVDLVATVTPIDLGVGAVHAPLSPVTVKTTVRPDWLFRPALGVSLLRATDAKYPTYGAKEVADGFEVVENGVQDSRVDWALMLSFAPRGLDWRDSNGFAVWLPTLLVNPSDSVSALGFGLGLSYKALKLDAGFIWTKHPVLDDQIVGQHLGAAEDLRTETGYGEGKFFVGFSIVGWAPFKSE
jgi:hypothetical protein